MKSRKPRSPSPAAGARQRELVAKISAAQKQVEIARQAAKDAKLEFKRVRKAHRQAKKSAKAARREFKSLRKLLAAAHASATRRKRAQSVRSVRVRKAAPIVSISSSRVTMPVPAVPAPMILPPDADLPAAPPSGESLPPAASP